MRPDGPALPIEGDEEGRIRVGYKSVEEAGIRRDALFHNKCLRRERGLSI